MIDLKKLEVWFLTGSQHLYGEETLKQVAADSQQIVRALDGSVTRRGSLTAQKREETL